MHALTDRPRFSRPVCLALAALACFILGGLAAPEPDPVPRRWQLDVDVAPLRVASVDVPGVGPRMFFYITYKVTNPTREDVLFAPAWFLSNDEGELLRSGRDVPTAVTHEILRRLDNPLLMDQIQVLGLLLQGPENAREGLAIWPVTDFDASQVSLFGAGFSGETRKVTVRDPKSGKPRTDILRKTIMLRYAMTGDVSVDPAAQRTPAEVRWIMR